jgi:hypothetical protein
MVIDYHPENEKHTSFLVKYIAKVAPSLLPGQKVQGRKAAVFSRIIRKRKDLSPFNGKSKTNLTLDISSKIIKTFHKQKQPERI